MVGSSLTVKPRNPPNYGSLLSQACHDLSPQMKNASLSNIFAFTILLTLDQITQDSTM